MEVGCNREKCHETLDLDAPLLSTRRLGGSTCSHRSCCSDVEQQRVPFLWERVPGKPKDADSSSSAHVEEPPLMPLPKPPPCRWHPPTYDDGNEEDEDDDDMFLDAIDRISLSESLDNHCSTSRASGLDGLDLKAIESCGDQSPNFIMSRFLPAATALAASSILNDSSSILNDSTGLNKKPSHAPKKEIARLASRYRPASGTSKYSGEHGVLQTQSPPKACGLELFFPWSLKHALNGLKNPIPSCSPRLRLRRNGRRKDAVKGDDGPSRDGWI